MSESPGSVMASTHTRWSFPQAVPSSTLSVFFFFFFFVNEVVVGERKKREGGGERKNEERKNEIESLSFTSSSLHKKKTNPLTASVVVHARLRKHRVVLDLRLAHGRAVVRDDHELALAAAQALERRLEAEGVLARLDDERQPGVDVLLGLFL